MSLRIRVSPEAQADLKGAYVWYEQAQEGLGEIFLDSVDQALNRVAEFPESGRIVDGDIRRVLTPRFPYGLSYVVDQDEIFVLGCFHLRRDPQVWTSRLPGSRDA